MREYVVEEFLKAIEDKTRAIKRVAVVGGSKFEPEILALGAILNFELDIYGIEQDNIFLDLNESQSTNRMKQYDLVVCSQVVEHIYDLHQGLINLMAITRPGGYLWIGCPASNRSHGSPEYYSAGYQPELFRNLFIKFGWKVHLATRLGSHRYYFMNHGLRVWANKDELKHPVTKYDLRRLPGPRGRDLLRFLRDLPGRFFSLQFSAEVTDQVEYSTETYVLVEKPV